MSRKNKHGKTNVAQLPVKKAVEAETAEALPPDTQALIPLANLNEVYNWLNSDRMSMPQNEVRRMLALLKDSKNVVVKKEEKAEEPEPSSESKPETPAS